AAGVAATAALLAGEADWRWSSVAAETFGAARDRGRLEAQLADVEGRVAVQALQALQRLVPDSDSSLSPRARTLLRHPDAAVRWGRVAPIITGRTLADYRVVARRYLLPARRGGSGPRVTLVTERGPVVVELFPAEAPLTVATFLSLVERRYFDGSTWHRVVPNFVVQDGDPRGDGWGGPGFALRDETNPMRYETGTVGM